MTAGESVTIILPLPPRELHAHAKGSWKPKSAATRTCRSMAYAKALEAGAPRFLRGTLSVRFYWPNMLRRDTFNAVSSIKPYIDGIVDAGVLPDDCWTIMEIGAVTSTLDRENPRVVLTITRLEAE